MAEKTASKSAPKNTPKVFDISKPGKQTASASSRPIIVTNRPIMQDPLITPAESEQKAPSESGLSPTQSKVKIVPLSGAKKKADDSGEKVSVSTAASKNAAKTEAAAEEPADGPAADKSDDAAKATAASKELPVDIPPLDEDEEKPEETEAEPTETAGEPDKADTSAAADAGPDSTDSAAETPETPDGDLTKPDEATAELEAEAKKQAELDKLVEERTYFLPINAVERRRSKVVSVLGLVLIVLLALVLLDAMMDAGFIHINGVQPLTHFFGV